MGKEEFVNGNSIPRVIGKTGRTGRETVVSQRLTHNPCTAGLRISDVVCDVILNNVLNTAKRKSDAAVYLSDKVIK